MSQHLKRNREMTEEEKKKIARDMIEGYKKMAALNQELAEDGFAEKAEEKSKEKEDNEI